MTPKTTARLAGLAYLVIIACGLFAEIGVRGMLMVPGDAEATAAAIAANAGRFRLGIAADLVMALADATLALLLYALMRPAGAGAALAATVFRLLQTSVIAAGLVLPVLALEWVAAGEAAQALAALDAHALLYDLGLAFFAVTVVLTGWLLPRAGVIPRWIGGLLMASGPVYLTGTLLALLAPDPGNAFEPAYLLAVVAELSTALWLLFGRVGARATPAAG